MPKQAAPAKKGTARTKHKVATKKPKQTAELVADRPRRFSKQSYVQRRTTIRSIQAQYDRLPNTWQLTKTTANLLWQHKQLFITITLIYGALNILLVRGLAGSTNVGDLKDQLSSVFTGNFGPLFSSVSIFVLLIGSSGNSSNETAGAYQLFLALIVSLAVIWALRQVMAGHIVRARDAYYKGMYPLIPFGLVLLLVGLQLIPLLIGSTLYSAVITNGIAVQLIEKILWAILFGALALWTLYMISASLFALYIVSLPDMTPFKALHSAKSLVRYRRWTVLRKILFLPLLLLIIAAVVMVPIIIVVTPLAQWVFFLLSVASIVAIHGYMYTLYRELLDE